jgi:hypothetical protein
MANERNNQMINRFYDLKFDREPDGGIYLEQQSGLEEPDTIFLHPAQLRHIAETFGLVAPNYPADELTKRLAVQLCTILRELEDERHRSPRLDMTYTKLDAWCSALPDDIFPHHVWDDEDDGKPIYGAQKLPTASANASGKAKAPTAQAIASSDDGQLGLAV